MILKRTESNSDSFVKSKFFKDPNGMKFDSLDHFKVQQNLKSKNLLKLISSD